MSHNNNVARQRLAPLLAFLAGTTVALPALAADTGSPAASSPEPARTSAGAEPAPSPNATINLIRLLVEQGVLSAEQAAALIEQANNEAAAARAAMHGEPAEGSTATTVAPTPAPAPEDSMRVIYVPEAVREQIKEEVRQEVMAQAQKENWAAPNTFPEWVSRIRFYGDVRGRYEGILYPEGNDNTGTHVDFNAINTGSPYDVSPANPSFYPTLNVDQDRDRYRIRARLGLYADLGDNFSSGVRIATGSSSSPVSPNQSFGRNGGNFSKYEIWLDRAFIRYQSDSSDQAGLSVNVGRFDNPFFSTSLVWDGDLGFDGVAFSGKYNAGSSLTPFFTAGAFPIFNTDLNFASERPAKFGSNDKYLYGAQLGFDWGLTQKAAVKFGAAYYYFDNVEGRLSSPCLILTSSDSCDTDETRPSFAQKGNSYMALRNIVPTPENNFGTTDQYQYFGLATKFEPVALTARLDYDGFAPAHVAFTAEFIKNLAFDEGRLEQNAINNRDALEPGQTVGDFAGGDTGYHLDLTVGRPSMTKRWDWNVGLGYKYLESDAMIDAFTDSDFGLGGTNLEGYILGGNLALGQNVWTQLRWISADEIEGAPYAVDLIQLDLNGRF